jgi:hypothetical protein
MTGSCRRDSVGFGRRLNKGRANQETNDKPPKSKGKPPTLKTSELQKLLFCNFLNIRRNMTPPPQACADGLDSIRSGGLGRAVKLPSCSLRRSSTEFGIEAHGRDRARLPSARLRPSARP